MSSSNKNRISDQEVIDATKAILMEQPQGTRVSLSSLYKTMKERIGSKATQISETTFRRLLRCYYEEIIVASVKLDPKSEAETLMVSLVE